MGEDRNLIIFTTSCRIIKTSLNGDLIWENKAVGSTNLNNNETISNNPVDQISGGYLVALRKIGYKLPVSGGVISPEISHMLILTKYKLNGEKNWEKTIGFPASGE